MSALLYIAAVFGGAGLYLTLPHRWSWPMAGAVIGLVALGLAFAGLWVPESAGPGVFFYTFTAIAATASVRVITHPRPIYSALYFVLVVLSTVGLLVLLDAEFMAMAMAIIYGGAILVTYMFVIMLATQPQSSAQPEEAPFYDRNAREPAMATLMGFVLIVLLGGAVVAGTQEGAGGLVGPDVAAAVERADSETASLAGRIDIDKSFRRAELELKLRRAGAIGVDEWVQSLDIEAGTAEVGRGEDYRGSAGSARRTVAVDRAVLGSFIHNTDRVGLNLFESHTLGIELAGVILLVSMVGAIVIGRRKVPEGT